METVLTRNGKFRSTRHPSTCNSFKLYFFSHFFFYPSNLAVCNLLSRIASRSGRIKILRASLHCSPREYIDGQQLVYQRRSDQSKNTAKFRKSWWCTLKDRQNNNNERTSPQGFGNGNSFPVFDSKTIPSNSISVVEATFAYQSRPLLSSFAIWPSEIG